MKVLHISEIRENTYRKVRNVAGTSIIDISIEELAPEITERMALLRVAPINEAVYDIGKHLDNDNFYLYFPDDFDFTRLRPQGGDA